LAPSSIFLLSLHDALPISTYRNTSGVGFYGTLADLMGANMLDSSLGQADVTAKSGYLFSLTPSAGPQFWAYGLPVTTSGVTATGDRKSTRLNSSHRTISYA